MQNKGEIYLNSMKGYVSNEELKILEYYFNKITHTTDDEICTFLHACLARIVSIVLKGDNPFVKEHTDTILKLIDVDNITKDLIIFCVDFIPISNNYLKHLDVQVEMLSLFCRNYVFGLVDRIHKNPDKIKRFLKLKELEYE